MKVKTNKRHRRIVRFFTTCYGFREPYKVLCDGTFIHHLLTNKMLSTDQALSDSLRGRAKPFTTKCVIGELKSLGASFSGTLEAASSLITARCEHQKRVSAAQCIEEVIGEDNSEHFFVATQDIELRNTLEEIPGVPVLYGLRNALFLDPPSESQRQHAVDMEEKRLHASEAEMMLLKKKRKDNLGTEMTTDDPEDEDSVVNSQLLARRDSTRRVMSMMDKAKFKRKRAQAPNPLSNKKKKTHPGKTTTPPTSNQGRKEEGDDGNASKKRIRKRKRSRKGNNQAAAAAAGRDNAD